ncbi:MAG: signal peptidase I [Simkaniaceae bacterium]|nr:signal peptidase I [Candidatus Sacchlamyda saccharinae]
MKLYRLKKSKKILIAVYQLWRRKKKNLLPAQVSEIKNDLLRLQDEVLKKNREGASYMAGKCADYANGLLRKSTLRQIRDFVFALGFALIFAFLIRQVWFELYEIPTGSMRPTLKEKDRLVVSKTDFGINVPFTTKHFYFDPSLVKRSGIIVFTVENMDVHDSDTMYFWLFPGKKQFVKRMMGRAGDTVYFYGGRLYAVDSNGTDVSSQYQLEELDKIDHIPFMQFDGNVAVGEPFRMGAGNAYRMAVLYQMNEPVARLTEIGNNRFEGEMLYTPQIHNRGAPPVKNYSDLWGIGNYASVKIVPKEETRSTAERHGLDLEEGRYYLEIKHHPDLKHLELSRDFYGRTRPQFILNTSLLPLDEEHLKEIFENIYTVRFVVKNGYATRYQLGGNANTASHNLVRLEGVPDGTYEFYYGKGYEIKWGGYAKELRPSHPLMRFSPELTFKLFNYGIDFDTSFTLGDHFRTERFAYFRDGNFYLVGAPIFKKGDPQLQKFVETEIVREEQSNSQNPYKAFVDVGPPLDKNGEIDVEKIRQFGLLIPPKSYLALGDNFAASGDSREFGFVPQGNLRGGPSFIFWPFGPRFGPPNQPSFPWLTIPNSVVWILALICFAIWYVVHRRHHALPLKDLE